MKARQPGGERAGISDWRMLLRRNKARKELSLAAPKRPAQVFTYCRRDLGLSRRWRWLPPTEGGSLADDMRVCCVTASLANPLESAAVTAAALTELSPMSIVFKGVGVAAS